MGNKVAEPANDGGGIYKIIYHSNIAFEGGHDEVVRHIRDIMNWSRDWNPRHGITGALMLNDSNFSQVLEGPPNAVKSLFGHIACDRRHKNIELLQCDYFERRDFAEWAMAYVGSATETDIKLASSSKVTDARLSHSAGGIVTLLRLLLDEPRITDAIR